MSTSSAPGVKCLLFDCDNTLVLSEDAAFEACADLVNELLASHNIKERYTSEELMVAFIGQKFRGMVAALQKVHNFTVAPDVLTAYSQREEQMVIAKLEASAEPCPGSVDVLRKLYSKGEYGLAVASSSALPRIRAALTKAGHDVFFDPNNVFSAATSLPKPAPKPDPGVYLHALETLGVKPEECVTVEDSVSGAASAIRANVPCIGYVGAYRTMAKRLEISETLLTLGCRVIMTHWSEYEKCLQEML